MAAADNNSSLFIIDHIVCISIEMELKDDVDDSIVTIILDGKRSIPMPAEQIEYLRRGKCKALVPYDVNTARDYVFDGVDGPITKLTLSEDSMQRIYCAVLDEHMEWKSGTDKPASSTVFVCTQLASVFAEVTWKGDELYDCEVAILINGVQSVPIPYEVIEILRRGSREQDPRINYSVDSTGDIVFDGVEKGDKVTVTEYVLRQIHWRVEERHHDMPKSDEWWIARGCEHLVLQRKLRKK